MERAWTHCSYPISILSIPNHCSPVTRLYPTALPRHRAAPRAFSFCASSSSFASSWHWGNSNDMCASFFINQSQSFFVKEESPEVDLINGMQHARPPATWDYSLPVLKASKEFCWLCMDQSSYISATQSKPLRCLFWERALHPFSLLESVTPDKNKYHLTVPALGYFWQHRQVTEFQRAVSVCVCVYKTVDLCKIINYMQEETRTFSIGFIRYCGQSRQFKATQNPITFILAIITPSLFTIFS